MKPIRVVFAWENLGPSHFDRIEACAADPALEVTAIEFFETSRVYDWDSAAIVGVRRITLYRAGQAQRYPLLAWRLIVACLKQRPDSIFLCHYNLPPVFLAALVLRLLGIHTVTMIDSKFDDMDRSIWREVLKALLLAPYSGAMAGSRRTDEYLRFLGFRRRTVVQGFDTLDVARIAARAPVSAVPHAQRDFLVVARLIREKNLEFAMRAFAEWRQQAVHDRALRILGAGPLEAPLRALAAELGVADAVRFEGTATPDQVAQAMRDALALVFPSVQETYGFVVIEALALGLPVLISTKPGAVDDLIDNGVNGWLVDPWRPAGLVAAMALLDRDEAAWRAASITASATSERGDVRHFVSATQALAQPA
jgi:glycosyltransferase involved in cell wall biosynthesis